MTHFYVRFAVLPVMLFTVVLLLVHAQPYDDHELRQLVSPDGCPAPCFLGIRPGVTTSKEAMRLLKANAWVTDVVTINPENPYQIWWTWSKNAPAFLRRVPTNPTFPVNGEINSDSEYVSEVVFTTGLSLSDIALVWGIPHQSSLIFSVVIVPPDPSISAITSFPYEKEGFWASGNTPCPYIAHIWETPVNLRITNQFHGLALGLGMMIPVNRSTFMGKLREVSKHMCGF
jgi:hypothetical protein